MIKTEIHFIQTFRFWAFIFLKFLGKICILSQKLETHGGVEPCQVIATLRVISHCLVNVRTSYPQTCWSKLKNLPDSGGKERENYNIKNYPGVGDFVKSSKSIKSSKLKCLYDFLAETAYIMNVSYFVDFD